MTENELTAKVIEKAARLGLLVHHCQDSRMCLGQKGLPDLVIVGDNGVLFRELKSEEGDTSPDQDLWIYTLHQSGADVAVWRPSDLHDGGINTELEAIR